MLLIRLLTIIWALCCSAFASATHVYLATMEPGPEFWERFGHNAIVLSEQSFEDGGFVGAASFNFGYFDFQQQNFIVNFARGKMEYLGLVQDAAGDIANYLRNNRRVTLQKLALSDQQIAKLQAHLVAQTGAPNDRYRYDYFRNNCSSKVRDALNVATDGAFESALLGRSHGYTFRSLGLAHAQSVPWMYLGIHAGLGPSTDRPISLYEELFIPELLKRAVANLSLPDQQTQLTSIVAQTLQLGPEGPAILPSRSDIRWYFLVTGLALAILIAIGFRYRTNNLLRIVSGITATSVSLLLGLGGLLLMFLWFATDHVDAKANLNIMLFCPLLILAVASFAGSFAVHWQPSRLLQRVNLLAVIAAFSALAIKVLPSVKQQNIEWYLLILPILLALLFASRSEQVAPNESITS
jgi:hypothetical protein